MIIWRNITTSPSPSDGPKPPKTSSLRNDARWTNSMKSGETGSKRQIQNTLMFAISRDRHENFFTCFGKRCFQVVAPGQSRRHGQ